MKKKLLCALLVSSMLLGITACGTTNEPEETEEERTSSKQDKDKDKDSEDKSEVITVTAEAPAEDIQTEPAPEVEQPKELPVINDYKMVDGCMIFTADGKDYIYNIAENKMYPTELTKIEGRVIKAIYGKVVLVATSRNSNPEYYNLETGEFIGTTFSDNCYGVSEYNPVYTYEESFDGAGYKVGMINSQGEWAVPLSNEYSICKYRLSECQMYSSGGMIVLFTEASREVFYYDFLNDKNLDIGTTYLYSGNKALCRSRGNLNVYDITTGTSTTVLNNVMIDNITYTVDGSFVFQNTNDGTWKIVDSDLNVSELPLSEYNIAEIKTVTNDYIAFSAKNSAGTRYSIITDRNGNRVMEPLERASIKIGGDYALISGKYIDSWFILNLKTGEQTPIDKENFGGYNEASGKMILKKDGACYLATLDDPNTLINPFEICE